MIPLISTLLSNPSSIKKPCVLGFTNKYFPPPPGPTINGVNKYGEWYKGEYYPLGFREEMGEYPWAKKSEDVPPPPPEEDTQEHWTYADAPKEWLNKRGLPKRATSAGWQIGNQLPWGGIAGGPKMTSVVSL